MTEHELERQAEAIQKQDDLSKAFDQLVAAFQHFIIKLIERHTSMAATAALSLTKRHEERILQLEQRLDALEDHNRG